MSDLPEIEDIRRVTCNPDDVIVVRLKDAVSAQQAHQLGDRLRESFPTQKIVILDNGATLDVWIGVGEDAPDVVAPEPIDGAMIERTLVDLQRQRGGQRLGFDA